MRPRIQVCVSVVFLALLLISMQAPITVLSGVGGYDLSPRVKLQRILETLVYSPVVVEAYRYRRIIPFGGVNYSYVNPGGTLGNPCQYPMVDSRHHELYCWLERVFMPATTSLDIPNATSTAIPKGDSFLLAVAPTLLAQALAGVDILDEMKSYSALSRENWKRWWEAEPFKIGNILTFKYRLYSDYAPPDTIYAYYINYYREQLAKDSGSPVSALPMWSYMDSYYSLLGEIRRFALRNNLDLAGYTRLVIEWEIEGDAGVLYPTTMSTTLPRDYIDDRVSAKPIYSPSAELFGEDTLFPIPLPLFATKYYVSIIDLDNPVESLLDNMVFVGITPDAYTGSFNLRITVKTLNDTVLTSLVYTFSVGEEMWKFLETDMALHPIISCPSLQPFIEREYGSIARGQCSRYLEDFDLLIGHPLYDYAPTTVTLRNLSITGSYNSMLLYRNLPGYEILEPYSWDTFSFSQTYRASVKIIGYGAYGEALLRIDYHYRGGLSYRVTGIGSFGGGAEYDLQGEAYIHAIVRGGGSLPYPSHIILGDRYGGSMKRVNEEEDWLLGGQRLGLIYDPAPRSLYSHIGTGFLGYGESKGYSRKWITISLENRLVFSQHEYLDFREQIISEPYCGKVDVNPPPPITPFHIDIASNLVIPAYDYFYAESRGLALFYIDTGPLFLFPSQIANNSIIWEPVSDYMGTGKPNFIPLSMLRISRSDETRGFSRRYYTTSRLEENSFMYTYRAYATVNTVNAGGCNECPSGTTCVVDKLYEIYVNGFVYNAWVTTDWWSYVGRPHEAWYPTAMLGTQIFFRGAYFIPGVNAGYEPVEDNTSYLYVSPYIYETLPGDHVDYLVEGYYRGEKLGGDHLEVKLLLNGTVVRNTTLVFGDDNIVKATVEVPTLEEFLDLLGNGSRKLLSINNTNSTPVVLLTLVFSVPEKDLEAYALIKVKLGTGVSGKIVAVDYGVDHGTRQSLLLGFKVTDSWYKPFIRDPDIGEAPAEALPFISTSIEGVAENIFRELGLNASVKLYVINQSDPSRVYVVPINSSGYSLILGKGSYRAFVEVNVTLWDGETVRFRTKEKKFNITGDEPAHVDFKVPVTPVLRALREARDAREWSVLNTDLSYLIENFFLVFSKPVSYTGPLLKLLTGTQRLLSTISRQTCRLSYDLLPALALSIFDVADPNEIPSFCDYLYNFSQTLADLTDYVAGGGSDQSVIRSYAVKLATVKVYFAVVDEAAEFIRTSFLEGELPEYDTTRAIHNSFDPWNKLFRITAALAYINNLRSHIIRQLRIGVKFVALTLSLMVKDLLIAAKLFPFGDMMSKTMGWLGNMLGGEKSVIVRTVSRVFPSIQIMLNSMKIAAFTLTGMGLNLGLTNDMVKSWLVPAGYKGIDVGYAIANFFKFYRFLLSVVVNAAETDTVFEIVFQATTQIAGFMLLGLASFTIGVEYRYFQRLVLSGDGEGTIYDVMKAGYIADGATINSLKILEVLVSGLAFLVNFLRGIGGLMDYVSSVKSISAFKKLLGRTADNDVFLYLLKSKKIGDALDTVYRNNKVLGFMGRIGKPMVKLGETTTLFVLTTVLIDMLATVLMNANTMFHLLYPTRTPLDKIVTDYGSILKAFGRYKLVEARDPLNRSTYRTPQNLLDHVKSILGMGGASLSARNTRSYVDASGIGDTLFAGPSAESYWSITYSVEDAVNSIAHDLVEGNYLNMSELVKLVEYNDELMGKLELKYAEALAEASSDSLNAINIIDTYRMLITEFIKESYIVSISPHYNPDIVADLANMTTSILEDIRGLTPPASTPNIYYVDIKPYLTNTALKIVLDKVSGTGSPLVEVRISSEQFNVSQPVWNINLDTTDHIEVELSPANPNITIGIVAVSVLHSDYGLVGYTQFALGLSNLFTPWVYNTPIGTLLSLKEADVDSLNNTAILLHGLGNNFIVMNSTQPLSVNITSGGFFIRTVVIGDRYITVIWAVNTTDTIIALSTQIPQNTQTPTLPQLEERGEEKAVEKNPLSNVVSSPVALASLAVIITVAVVVVKKILILKKAR